MRKNQINYNAFKERLDNNHAWPSMYMFKFIVPREQKEEIDRLFPKNELRQKYSKNGKYISITAEIMMGSSEEVMHIYERAHQVKDVIAL